MKKLKTKLKRKLFGQVLCINGDIGTRVLLSDNGYSYLYYLPHKYFRGLGDNDTFCLKEYNNGKYKVERINKR